ncbi:MAG TPA: hypothetical protein VN577_21935 [Terriglobales bacterium]|nr:hypothetical protein [Terriglobales bacterium]
MSNSLRLRRLVNAVVCTTFFAITPMALAQADRGIYCAGVADDGGNPVLNAPYSGLRRVITTELNADGTTKRREAVQSEARDGKGRKFIAGERFWTTRVGDKDVEKSEVLVRIFDPVANTDTTWSSGDKQVKVVHWPKDDGNNSGRQPNPFMSALTRNSEMEKLGTKTIEGVAADGVRLTRTVPARSDRDRPTVSVSECWYSPELKVMILETNTDPARGTFTNQLENVKVGEPDVSKYQPPANYKRQDVKVP